MFMIFTPMFYTLLPNAFATILIKPNEININSAKVNTEKTFDIQYVNTCTHNPEYFANLAEKEFEKVTRIQNLACFRHVIIDKAIHTILRFYGIQKRKNNNIRQMRCVLNQILRRLDYREKSTWYFITHAVHNTSFFENLVTNTTDVYRSRGLLQITGKRNYEILDKVMGYKNYYVANPDILNTLTIENINAAITFYEMIVIPNALKKRGKVTFASTLEALLPVDFQKFKNQIEEIEQKFDITKLLDVKIDQKLSERARLNSLLLFRFSDVLNR